MKVANPQPIPGLDSARQRLLDRLRGANLEVRQITEGYHDEERELLARVGADRGLNAEGRQAAIARGRGPIAEKWTARLHALRAELEDVHVRIIANMERRWPKPATGLEALLSRQAAWARCRSLLESGALTPAALLAETTDIETLHALRAELPTWLRTRDYVKGPATLRDVDRRLSELAGESTSAAYKAAVQADAERAALRPVLDHAALLLRAEADRHAGMSVAIEAQQQRALSLNGSTSPAPPAGGVTRRGGQAG